MAKLPKGILGPISGKVGNMIFVTRNDKCYVKSLPRPCSKPATFKQVAQRSRFALAMGFVTPLKSFLKDSYSIIKPGLSPMNAAVKQILSDAITGEYPNEKIDYSKVILTKGSLSPLYNVGIRLSKPDHLKIDWTVEANPHNSFCNDKLVVLLYCESIGEFWFDPGLGIYRADGYCSVQVPPVFVGRETQVWLTFRSQECRMYSKSFYAGVIYKTNKRS